MNPGSLAALVPSRVFEVLPRDRAPGISESQLEKMLRVVSTIDYRLG